MFQADMMTIYGYLSTYTIYIPVYSVSKQYNHDDILNL